MVPPQIDSDIARLAIPLERDSFLRHLIGHLASTLQDTVGLQEASGFISVVGQHIGANLDREYRAALEVPSLTRDQVAAVLVDLKRRIQGDFYVIEADHERIVLGNRRCPFGGLEAGRPALCMMTSNVFGEIAAANLGYAKVDLEQTIATGAPECRVVVYLGQSPASDAASGREYVGG